MKPALCISFRFIQPYPLFHGRGDGDQPEWPPSPLRAFQALVNAACLRTQGTPLAPEVRSALQVIEAMHPNVIAPRATLSATGHRAYVPHNHADLVTAAWDRGNRDASIASHRVEKDYRPHRIHTIGDDLPTLHYVYPLDATSVEPGALLAAILPAVRSIHCLGWGVDQVIADATLVDSHSDQFHGERWIPTPRGGRRLRVHRVGSLDALSVRHGKFLERVANGNWTPVPALAAMDQVRYRRDFDPIPRPHAVFKLVDENEDTVAYPQSKLVHIAGMARHVAITAMTKNAPRDLRGRARREWLDSYVAGHPSRDTNDAGALHTQFSYVPLQSIGTSHTDPGVRRVMIIAPVGDDGWLDHLAAHLDGMLLEPDPKFPNVKLPFGTRLERIADNKRDGVRDTYLRPSSTWASVTPVILPGHDDRKPQKTETLIVKALQQSGIEQPCKFEWSPFSHFRQMLSAHKYRKDPNDPSKKILINYIRPNHLRDQTAVHLVLSFDNGLEVPGPFTLGAGRHCGFGVMATID